MDLRLQFLESFYVTGSDGASYKVCAYERQARDASVVDDEQWESTGEAEYRLTDGRAVEVRRDGSMRILGTEIQLTAAAGSRAQTSNATA